MSAKVEVHATIDDDGNGHVNVIADPIIGQADAWGVGMMVLLPLVKIKRARALRELRSAPTAVLEDGRLAYHFAEVKPPKARKPVGPSESAQD